MTLNLNLISLFINTSSMPLGLAVWGLSETTKWSHGWTTSKYGDIFTISSSTPSIRNSPCWFDEVDAIKSSEDIQDQSFSINRIDALCASNASEGRVKLHQIYWLSMVIIRKIIIACKTNLWIIKIPCQQPKHVGAILIPLIDETEVLIWMMTRKQPLSAVLKCTLIIQFRIKFSSRSKAKDWKCKTSKILQFQNVSCLNFYNLNQKICVFGGNS